MLGQRAGEGRGQVEDVRVCIHMCAHTWVNLSTLNLMKKKMPLLCLYILYEIYIILFSITGVYIGSIITPFENPFKHQNGFFQIKTSLGS